MTYSELQRLSPPIPDYETLIDRNVEISTFKAVRHTKIHQKDEHHLMVYFCFSAENRTFAFLAKICYGVFLLRVCLRYSFYMGTSRLFSCITGMLLFENNAFKLRCTVIIYKGRTK